jgi:hypothetical protein
MRLPELQQLKARVPTPLRRLGAWLVPMPSRLSSPNVSEARGVSLRDGVRLDVYWLRTSQGCGPAASLVAFGDEILRFDCLGPDTGHMHFNLKQTRGFQGGGMARLYFREQSIEEQIARSRFELVNNLPYALTTNASARIRHLRLAREELEKASEHMEREMVALLLRNGHVASTVQRVRQR